LKVKKVNSEDGDEDLSSKGEDEVMPSEVPENVVKVTSDGSI
jgi:hypothetical protein